MSVMQFTIVGHIASLTGSGSNTVLESSIPIFILKEYLERCSVYQYSIEFHRVSV